MTNKKTEIQILDTVDSTNSYILRNPELLSENFSAVRAIEQTNGRGRFNREWNSIPGEDLSMSIVFIPGVDIKSVSVLTIYAGIAVLRVLKTIIGNELRLKWPNDICFNGKKICGILCELAFNVSGKPAVILGIGVNINRLCFPEGLTDTSVSIRQITGKEYSVDILADKIYKEIQEILNDFNGIPIPESIIDEWMCNSIIDEEVSYYLNGVTGKGHIRRINIDGSLTIKDANTGHEFIYSGEIIYGS